MHDLGLGAFHSHPPTAVESERDDGSSHSAPVPSPEFDCVLCHAASLATSPPPAMHVEDPIGAQVVPILVADNPVVGRTLVLPSLPRAPPLS